MQWQHKTIAVKPGETVELSDFSIVAGSRLEGDGKGGWVIVIHILERLDRLPIATPRELAQ